MAYSSGQKYLAEFVGTFGLLLAITGGAVFTAVAIRDPVSRVTLISLCVGLALIGMICSFGDISGGHFNPAVTIAAWLAGRFSTRDVIPYILSQVAGAVLGVGVIAGVAYGNPTVFSAAQRIGLASQGYSGGSSPYAYSLGAVFLIEVALTFFLVMVILFSTRSEGTAKNLAPLGIGFALLLANLVGIPVDGASVNPARSFAPAILSSTWSSGNWAIGQDWLFWVAPIIGGLLAAFLDRALHPKVAEAPPAAVAT
jgi:aquaporin Z